MAAEPAAAALAVSAEQLRAIQSTMRAMRRLRPDPVPAELLERLVEAATWAPNASNVQGYAYLIVTDRAQLARLAELWAVCVDVYHAWFASAAPRYRDRAPFERVRAAHFYQRDHFAETPALIVACYDAGPWFRRIQRDRLGALRGFRRLGPRRTLQFLLGARAFMARSEAASIYPGVQNLLLTARSLGLGATLTTWHLTIEDDFKKVLGIPRHVNTFAVIPVGWPLGSFGPVRRRPVAEVVHRDRWGSRSVRPR
jgi:nitroreductase